MKIISFLGWAWLIFGTVALLGMISRFSTLPTIEELNNLTHLTQTFHVLHTIFPYLQWVLIVNTILSVLAIISGTCFIIGQSWSGVLLKFLSWLYLLQITIYAVSGSYLYYILSVDIDVPYLSTGIIEALIKVTILMVPFALTIYILKRNKIKIASKSIAD